MMTEEKFRELFDSTESELHKYDRCNAYLGLCIIAKYTNTGIVAARHDVIYSESTDKLIEAGITEEDVIELRKLNWMIEEEGYLACFV